MKCGVHTLRATSRLVVPCALRACVHALRAPMRCVRRAREIEHNNTTEGIAATHHP